MIFPLKRNFRDKIFEVSQDFSRGACEGPKFSRLKFSRPDKNPRNPRKFSPSKILGYTVCYKFRPGQTTQVVPGINVIYIHD